MKVKDFRCGNVILLDKEIWTVLVVDTIGAFPHLAVVNGKNFCHIQEDQIVGVPLTEDWLVTFGAKKQRNNFYRLPLNGVFDECDYMQTFDFLNFSFGYYGGLIIDSVHRLQNIYFALTGEELEIKQ